MHDTVEQNELNIFQQGGVCREKTFANFTHICQVTNYYPNTDHFCCCQFAHSTLCCDYHRDNNEFRCRFATDTVRYICYVINYYILIYYVINLHMRCTINTSIGLTDENLTRVYKLHKFYFTQYRAIGCYTNSCKIKVIKRLIIICKLNNYIK